MNPTPVSERHGIGPWDDCVFCSGVMIANVASANAKPATWDEANALRTASGDPNAPANPAYLAKALKVRYGWDVPPFVGIQSQLMDELGTKWGAVNIHYNLYPVALRQQPTFLGGHCIVVGPTKGIGGAKRAGYLWVIDPLFKPDSGYTGQWVAAATIKAALNGSLANLVAVNQFAPTHPPEPHVRVIGEFYTYTVTVSANGNHHATGDTLRTLPLNTIIPVAAIETSVILANGTQTPMRQVTGGTYAGAWVIAHGNLVFST